MFRALVLVYVLRMFSSCRLGLTCIYGGYLSLCTRVSFSEINICLFFNGFWVLLRRVFLLKNLKYI